MPPGARVISKDIPYITCICPTYKRPGYLQNLLACFLAQDYPASNRRLIIFDDAAQFDLQCGESWVLMPFGQRFDNLPEKYNAMAALARGGIISIWEDDDIYLPWHLSTIAAAYAEKHADYLVPRYVYSTTSRVEASYRIEQSGGRFHGAWAFTWEAWRTVGGYTRSERLTFDQEMGRRLEGASPGGLTTYSHPLHHATYVYRWGNDTYHGSQAGDAGFASLWDELEARDAPYVGLLAPAFDAHTRQIFESIGAVLPPS